MTSMIDEIFHRDLKIDELNRERFFYSNNVYNIKRHKYKLKNLKEGRKDKNRAEFDLEDSLLQHITK